MKEQLFEKIYSYLTSVETFVKDQVPDFVNQYLTWCFYEHLFFIVLWALLIGVSFFAKFIWCNCVKKLVEKDYDSLSYNKWTDKSLYEVRVVSSCFCAFICLIFIIVAGINSYGIVKIKVAPKVYLMEKIAETIKR